MAGLTFMALIGAWVVISTHQARATTCKRTTELSTCVALESAVNNFHIEYGAIPKVATKVRTNTPEGVKLLTILLGMEKSAAPENGRAIKFLSVKEGKDAKNGLIYDPTGASVVGLFDRWGSPYTVMLDQDDDEQFQVGQGKMTKTLKGRRVAVTSPGKDGRPGTPDDIVTW